MNKFLTTLTSIFLLSCLAAPAQASDASELLGLGFGAATGGIIGNQFGHGTGRVATTAAGVFAGGYIGDEIGRRLNQPDTFGSAGYASYAAPSVFDYQSSYAPNYVAPSTPDPSAIYMNNGNDGCRVIPLVTPAGVWGNYGIACPQPDGSWRVMP